MCIFFVKICVLLCVLDGLNYCCTLLYDYECVVLYPMVLVSGIICAVCVVCVCLFFMLNLAGGCSCMCVV